MNDPSSTLLFKALLFGALLSCGGLSLAQPMVRVTAFPDGSPTRQPTDWKSTDDGFLLQEERGLAKDSPACGPGRRATLC